jgi:hypothetical protein
MSTISSNTADRSTRRTANARLGSRPRLISAALATIAALVCSAAVSAPAQAAAAQASTVCHPEGVSWSSAPFSDTMTGTMCDNSSTASCKGGPTVATSVAGWASKFVKVSSVTGGCFYGNTLYGTAETMWANVSFRVTDPLTGGSDATGTTYLRTWMNPNGTVHKWAGTSENMWGLIVELVKNLL